MPTKCRILTFTLTLLLTGNALALERQTLLPANQLIYVRVSNIPEFLARLKQSPLGQLWADPPFQNFIGRPTASNWMDLLLPENSTASKQIMLEQLKMLQGELIVGLNQDTEGVRLIASMSVEDYQRHLKQEEKLNKLANNPREIINETFQGIKLIRRVRNGGTKKEETSWQAHLADTILLGSSREWIERSIIQLKKTHPNEPSDSPTLDLKIDLATLIEKIVGNMKQSNPSTQPNGLNKKALVAALGLTGVGDCSMTLRLDEDKMVSDSTLDIATFNKGLFTLLDMQPSTLPTVTFIPENISAIGVGRINLLSLWQEVPEILSAVSPNGQMQFAMIADMIQQQARIDLGQDLLANLDSHYISYSTTAPGTAQQAHVIGIKLKDRVAFQTALETALAAPALQPQVAALLKTEPFLEHTIYTIQTQQPGSPPVAFSIAANRFFYGPPTILRNIIRTQNSADAAHTSFEHSPLVRELRRHTPSGAFGFRVIDWKKQMESLVKQLRQPAVQAALKKGLKGGPDQPFPLPDLATLPPADHLASFFNTTCQYVEKTDTGLHQRATTRY